MKFLKPNLVSPYSSIESTNFPLMLSIAKLLKRIGAVLLIIAILFKVPKWIIGSISSIFNDNNFSVGAIFTDILFFGSIPLFIILISNVLAILVSCEEKLRIISEKNII